VKWCDIDECDEAAKFTRLVGVTHETAAELDLCPFHHFVMADPDDDE
jgi:hypothetical protein